MYTHVVSHTVGNITSYLIVWKKRRNIHYKQMSEADNNKEILKKKLKSILEESFPECEGVDEKIASKFIKINKEAFDCLKILGG